MKKRRLRPTVKKVLLISFVSAITLTLVLIVANVYNKSAGKDSAEITGNNSSSTTEEKDVPDLDVSDDIDIEISDNQDVGGF